MKFISMEIQLCLLTIIREIDEESYFFTKFYITGVISGRGFAAIAAQ